VQPARPSREFGGGHHACEAFCFGEVGDDGRRALGAVEVARARLRVASGHYVEAGFASRAREMLSKA